MRVASELRRKLKAGETVYGPFLRLTTPQAAEIFGYAGFDFCIIDMEHGPHSFETVENIVRAAHGAEIAPIVRVSHNAPWMIQRSLDAGAHGVQVPGVGTADEAAAAVRASRYAPHGERGVCRVVASAGYSSIPAETYFQESAEEVVVAIHIEGAGGVKNLDDILAVPGLDIIFFGPYDLSQYLGLTGQVDHPKVLDLVEGLVERVHARGLTAGVFSDAPGSVETWRNLGVQYISVGIDTGILYNSAKSYATQLKGES